MKERFPGWTPPDESILKSYWETADFVPDTNVLLDLYRYSNEGRQDLLKALKSLDDRLWVPYQVIREFHRNRPGVYLDQQRAEEEIERTLTQLQPQVEGAIAQSLRDLGRRSVRQAEEAVRSAFEGMTTRLREDEASHLESIGSSLAEDQLYEEIAGMLDGKVGDGFDEERLAELYVEGEERFKLEKPPGFHDVDKPVPERYGDLVVWKELCERAVETERPIVLITDDQKTDWWWTVRGRTLGPHPELVAEIHEIAEVGFHLYTPGRFTSLWKSSGKDESDAETLKDFDEEAERPASDTEALIERFSRARSEPVRPSASRRKVRRSRPIPSHQVYEENATLGLSSAPGISGYPGIGMPEITCAVVDPSGTTTVAKASINLIPTIALGPRIQATYPDDFAGADYMEPGLHQVVWFHKPAFSAVLTPAAGGEREIARDSFVAR